MPDIYVMNDGISVLLFAILGGTAVTYGIARLIAWLLDR